MITHTFDLAVINNWLEYRLDTERAGILTKDTLDLFYFKMNVAQCLSPESINQWQPNMEDTACPSEPTNPRCEAPT